jgi:hypothetical protein
MHAIRIDEILLRRGNSGLVKVIAPPVPAHQESILGRPFGFLCINVPRTPQIDKLASEAETAIERAYANGNLHDEQTPEQFFEETVASVRKSIAAALSSARIKIDPSLMTIALACVFDSNIFLTRHGQAEAYLIRRQPGQPSKTLDIFRGYADDADDGRLMNDLVVGSVAENDLLLIATESLFDANPIADIVESIGDSEPAAVAARIRSIVIASPGTVTVAGCLMRLSPVRPMFRAKDNPSVKNLRTREEEVARTLSPSGLPGVSALFDRLKSRPPKASSSARSQTEQPKPQASPARAPTEKRPVPLEPKRTLIERFNALPTAARRGAIVLLALLAIFLVSLELISIDNARKSRGKEFDAAVQAVRKQIELSESTLIYDEARALSILEEARTAEKGLPSRNEAEKEAKTALESELAAADRRLQHLYDVDLKTIEALSAGASFIIKTADGYLTDSGADLIALDANGSAKNIATLPAAPIWAAQSADNDGTVYLWLANDTLVSVSTAGKSLPRALDYGGPEKPRAGAGWSGRLYALSSDGKQIWKLPATLTGFGRGTEYLSAPFTGAGATAIAIDGSIYAAISGDAIRSFSKGKIETFAASGATANAAPVALSLGKDGVYLLGGDNTIAVWDRNGKLLAQYSLPENGGKITAFAVDETAKQIIVANDKGVVSRFEMAK